MLTTAGRTAGTTLRTLGEAAHRLHIPLGNEARVVGELLALRQSGVWDAPAADPGQPVVLVGGMASTATTQLPMRRWLERGGHPVTAAPVRLGLDCGERTTQRVLATLEAVAEQHGRPAAVIAHSRGGQYARVAAVRRPELVQGLVTLGSPLTRLLGVHQLLKVECVMIGLAGTAGVGGVFGAGCLWGQCCRRLRRELSGDFPDVPFLSVFSRADEVVDWTSCLDPSARHLQVDSSHGGLLANEQVYAAVRRELDRATSSRPATAPAALALAA